MWDLVLFNQTVETDALQYTLGIILSTNIFLIWLFDPLSNCPLAQEILYNIADQALIVLWLMLYRIQLSQGCHPDPSISSAGTSYNIDRPENIGCARSWHTNLFSGNPYYRTLWITWILLVNVCQVFRCDHKCEGGRGSMKMRSAWFSFESTHTSLQVANPAWIWNELEKGLRVV